MEKKNKFFQMKKYFSINKIYHKLYFYIKKVNYFEPKEKQFLCYFKWDIKKIKEFMEII